MNALEMIIDNWYVIVGILAILVIAGFAIYKFAGLPTQTQVTKIKEWLLYAVTIAEKDLGEKTGKIKLRMVYDAFVTKFPTTAKLVSFETFSLWVDDALEQMKIMLAENEAAKKLVKGE